MSKWPFLWASFFLAGCSTSVVDSERRAEEHMRVGAWLESAQRWNEAAEEYAAVVKLYPQTEAHDEALKRAALLFSHPDNPHRNDSTALEWLERYSKLPLAPVEFLSVQLIVKRMLGMCDLEEQLRNEIARGDSLIAYQEGLQKGLMAWSTKVKNLQEELRKVNQKLGLMREIDAKVGRDQADKP